MTPVYDYIETQIGKVYIVMNEVGVIKIEVIESKWYEFIKRNYAINIDKEFCKDAVKQVDEYFKGERKEVWKALMEIPYGETRSYSYIAKKINNEKAVRAIGQANKSNLLPIIIPCHRKIGKNNKLIGYAGDNIDVQLKLIELEKTYK